MGFFDFLTDSNSYKERLEKGSLYDVKSIKKAIKEGGNVESEIKFSNININLIDYAVMRSSKSLLNLLIDKGANINPINNLGRTPLHTAIIFDNKRFADLLISKKADLNIKDNQGKTPLHHAAIKSDHAFVHELLTHGAKVNIQDSEGKTPLHYACLHGNIKAAIELMTKDDSILNIQDLYGQTALHVSITNPSIIAVLMACGADNKIPDKNGNTPLDLMNNIIKLCAQNIQIYYSFEKLQFENMDNFKISNDDIKLYYTLINGIVASKSILDKYENSDDEKAPTIDASLPSSLIEEFTTESSKIGDDPA